MRFPDLLASPPSSRLVRCGVGLLVALAGVLLRLTLNPLLSDQVPFAFALGAVTFAAWIAGGEGGVVAVLVSAVLVDYAIVPPRYDVKIFDHLPALLVFLVVAFTLVWQVGRWRRAEQALRQSEMTARETGEQLRRQFLELEATYQSAPTGLCVIDRNMRWLRLNARLAEMNGYPVDAHIGKTVRELLPDVADQAEAGLRQIVDTGEALPPFEISGTTPAQPGVQRWWKERWAPIKDDQGTVIGVAIATEEITEQKQAERALREAMEELRSANRAKDDFLATLSHELRTPLNAIMGWSQMLARGGLDQRLTQQAVDTIFRNAQAQTQLVTDVLDVSRMMSGKLRLSIEEVDAIPLLRQVIESVQPAADAKQLELHMFADLEPALLSADPARLRQVFWNLLANAVKFTPTGGRITACVSHGDSTLDVTMTDSGIGIAPAFLPHVFERFSQADGSTTRQHSGLGLGLAIVRHLVELHGGTVHAMSDGEGRGATFTVSFPAQVRRARDHRPRGTAVPATASAVTDPPPSGLHVLVVDDMDDARNLVAAMLEREGMRVTTAASAEEALQRTAAVRPDVVIADIAMPGADGYEFLRRLRELPAEAGGRIPAIALTAYGSATDPTKVRAAGFLAHLTKPVLRDDLLAAIAAQGKPGEPPGATSGGRGRRARMR